MSTVISYIFTCYSGVAEENVLPRVTGWSRHLCLRLGLDNTGLQPLRLPIPCHLSGQPSDRTSHPCPHPSVIPTENRTTEGEVRLSGGTPTICPLPCRIREFSPEIFRDRRNLSSSTPTAIVQTRRARIKPRRAKSRLYKPSS